MESKKINLSKIFNWVALLLGVVLLATLIGAAIFAPVASINALTKNDIIGSGKNQYNIHFVTAKTNSAVTNGLVLDDDATDGSKTFSKYSYNRVPQNSIYYFGDSGATSYGDKKYGSILLEENNSNSLLLHNSTVPATDTYSKTNTAYIPTNTTHYKNVYGEFEEIFYDDTIENGFVFLNNYNITTQANPTPVSTNYENFYIAFGSPYSEKETRNYVREFSVSGVLYNTSGERHELVLNSPEDDAKPNGSALTFWYQYFDLTNIQGDNGTSTGYTIANQEGKYEITFTNIYYYDNNGNASNIGNYTYTFYLLDSANYAYPTITGYENDEVEKTPNQPFTYFSQMGKYDSYISYDASRFKIDYTRLNYEYSENVTTTFTTTKYNYNGKPLDMGILTYKDSFKDEDNQIIKQTYILTHKVVSSNDKKIEYMYLTNNDPTNTIIPKTTKTKVSYEYEYEDIAELIKSDKLSYEYIRVEEITDDAYNSYIIDTYPNYDAIKNEDVITKPAFNIDSPFNDNGIPADYLPTVSSVQPTTTNRNGIVLNERLTYAKLDVNYLYNMPVDELGQYEFTYSYICPTVENDKNEFTTKRNIAPVDFTQNYQAPATTPGSTDTNSQPLYLSVWGYLDEKNRVELNNVIYEYKKLASTEYINGFSFNAQGVWENNEQLTNSANGISAALTLETTSNGAKKVIITYTIGSYTTSTTTIKYSLGEGLAYYEDVKTTYTITLDDKLSNAFKDTSKEDKPYLSQYESFGKIITALENLDSTANQGAYTIIKKLDNKSTAGKIAVHSFGSIAYFNKDDATTDSGYQKLQDTNKRIDFDFTADITNKNVSSKTDLEALFTNKTIIAEKDKTNPNKIVIVNTNAVPVLWRNYSSIDATSSKIYYYPNAVINSDKSITLGTASPEDGTTFTKDSFCGENGLYIVVITYTYADYPNTDGTPKSFTQVFTFMVNNTSPTFDINIESEQNTFTPLEGKYTNKNVQISWNIPNSFQYDVYIELEQQSYAGKTLFKGNYYNESQKTLPASFTSIKDVDGKHIISLNSTAESNGKYLVTIRYGKNGNSSTTKVFYIDNTPISNMNIYAVYTKSANGTSGYYADITSSLKNITNKNFTFRYDKKASGAPIDTYFYKLNIVKDTNINIAEVTSNNRLAVTTQYKIKGNESTANLAKYYNYNYDDKEDVNVNNCFVNTDSCLYLFTLQDRAGNTATFVVFFDKTSPAFIITPEVGNASTRIINQTTQITWGDYKAITIEAPNSGINTTAPITTLDKILREINLEFNNETSDKNKFNNTSFEDGTTSDYLFIPLTTKTMENTNTDKNIKSNTSLSNYYLFPTNPVSDGKITLLDNNNPYTIVSGLTSGNPIKGTYLKPNPSDQTPNATIETSLEGMIGSGVYVFTIGDKLDNTTSSLLWMNLDATQTFAYGLFGNESYISNNSILYNESPATYALNELYISSLPATTGDNNDIPEYELTYTYYPINPGLYIDENGNSNIEEIEYVKNGSEEYLNIKIKGKPNAIKYLVKDEDGNSYPLNSYPYDLEGNSFGHVYGTNNVLANKFSDNSGRIYSNLINPTLDENQRKVTKEGFYIFKRTYTEQVELPTNDSRIIYRSYYVDRNGIIDTTNSMKIGKDIGFTLGAENSDTADNTKEDPTGYRVIYTADDIYSSINIIDNSSSNKNHETSTLFVTNKMLLNYRITSDKYNFIGNFFNKFGADSQIQSLIKNDEKETNGTPYTTIANTLFNNSYFSDTIYKLDFSLYLGDMDDVNSGKQIIDETKNTVFSNGFENYFDSSPKIGNQVDNDMYIHFGSDYSNYYSRLYDQARKIVLNADGSIDNTATLNYANQLTMKFQIVHTPPEGSAYGKLYGNQHETNYDNDISPNGTNSIPTESFEYNGQQNPEEYSLLYEYLDDLILLSDGYKNTEQTGEGSIISLYSTNNKTLIFVFIEETQDNTKAKIDTNNISIWQGNENSTKDICKNDSALIFKRENGIFKGNSKVSEVTMRSAYITNVINNIIYHAVIVFDDNLDEIYSDSEKNTNNQPGKLKYRLLDSNNNPANAKYFIQIQYVGNKENYQGTIVNTNNQLVDDDGNKKTYATINYYQSIYDVTIDRRKPNYNLTKLMEKDKYYNSEVKDAVSSTNHNSVFESYKQYYNITEDSENGFTSSELGKYFFAVDSRTNSSFAFESVSSLDNQGVIYFRKLGGADYAINNYKYSITPDNHQVYNGGTDYAVGHPRFSTTTAKPLDTTTLSEIANGTSSEPIENSYYKLEFNTSIDPTEIKLLNDERLSTSNISISKLIYNHIFLYNHYYEIIECDEAGNYRVYGIYIPEPDKDSVTLSYEETSKEEKNLSLNYNNSTANISGTSLTLTNYLTKENYLKANIKITSEHHKYNIDVTYQPLEQKYYVHYMGSVGSTTINYYDDPILIEEINKTTYGDNLFEETYIGKFIALVNKTVATKSQEISDSVYGEAGHSVILTLVNRIGLHTTIGSTNLFNDFKINHIVAGNIIKPEFPRWDVPGEFKITIPGIGKGQTYITDLNVYKFNNSNWETVIQDKDGKTFTRTITQFQQGQTFTLTYGVWKFELTDNFGRTNTYFKDFISGTSVPGGELKFQSKYIQENNNYVTGYNTVYSYNHQSYSVYIKFYGNYYVATEDGFIVQENNDGILIYTPNDIMNKDYSMYGISSVTKNNDITTITFTGINNQPSARYEIKTVFAGTGDKYTWGQEENNTNSDLIVYNKEFTIYKAIQTPIIKNLNGSIIDISSNETVNLTEDVQLITKWDSSYTNTRNLKSYDSKIILTRTYTENGHKLTETSSVDSGYKIDKFGTYTAYVENSIGVKSNTIKFVRTKDTISQYAVYAVNNLNNTEEQVIESNLITQLTNENQNANTSTSISEFNYFVKQEYFSYLNSNGQSISFEFTGTFENDEANPIKHNPESNYFIEIRVSSNLNLFSKLNKISRDTTNNNEVCAEYEIYTMTTSTDENGNGQSEKIESTYRILKVYFLRTQPDINNPQAQTTPYDFLTFVNATVTTQTSDDNLVANNIHNIKSTEKTLFVKFDMNNTKAPKGDTVYIDRYYNSNLIETITLDWIGITQQQTVPKPVQYQLNSVGLHTFKVRDMSKRNQTFDISNNTSTSLDLYLVNEVLYQVNDESPINNQIFNNDVKLQVLTEMNGEKLYKNNISYSVFKNGIEIKPEIVDNTIIFTEHGYYTVIMDATTELFQEGTIQTDKEVSSTYNFVIIKENISMKSFGISNGKFVLDSVIKISEGYSTPLNYYNPNSLIWLTYQAPTEVNPDGRDLDKIYGNAKYQITLKYYDETVKAYRPFTFKVWISGDSPNILSSVAAGTSTKDDITLTFNPGLIYTQRGKCYVKLNGETVVTIDENSDIIPQTITISKKGEYLLEIYSADDETLILSSKYVKKEAFNAITKIILISVSGGLVALAGVFFFIRRKGKYR